MSVKLRNEVCGTNESSQPKNLGGKKQCIEGAVITGFLSRDDFSFDSVADSKDLVKIKAAIQAKNLVPLPEFETVEDENTDPTTVEKRTKTIVTKQGVAGSKYGVDASMCTYEALKTYQDSDYTRIFEITDSDDEEMTCDIDKDGKVWGRKLTSTIVGLRTRTNLENDASVPLSLKFENDTYSILKTGQKYSEIEGIFDVALEVIGMPNATTLIVKATTGCVGDLVETFVQADFIAKTTLGVAQPITAMTEVDGVYTLTGTFATGTIATNVAVTTNAMYEAGKTSFTV